MIKNNHSASNLEAHGLAAERLEKIRALLKARRIIRVDELTAELAVSPATIRRDLVELEKLGRLERVHGGAVSLFDSRMDEPLFDDKTALAVAEKQRIAEAALACIKPADSIFLDGGSTVLALARLLTGMNSLTVVTNSLRVATLYAGAGPHMILTGGEVRRLSQTMVGPTTRPLLDQLHVDTAFMGTIGLSPEAGLTTTDPREAQTKAMVMAQARQVVLLADSSKISKVSFVKFGPLSQVQLLITDTGADAAALRKFRREGVKIVIV
jgi:DeoR/GlpR family transcriptional regulator of sugar metabolism